MEHKKKGMYVNKINETTYRIYRGHSERIKGTKKVKRVVDEYIGTITEEGGLQPTKPKVKGEVRTVRYGGYAILWWYCRTQIEGVLKRMGEDGPPVVATALLHVMYGDANPFYYECDWVGVAHPGVLLPLSASLESEAKRVARGLGTTLGSALGGDVAAVLEASAFVCRVWVNGRWVTSVIPAQCKMLAQKYGFCWEV
ncbi:MAG TPA: hypothetical protein VJ863_00665 [Sphaerochaeta sp.]|nr:hypothetical protein [Sphaerochaeta sp.]